jgi:hypothetical protein
MMALVCSVRVDNGVEVRAGKNHARLRTMAKPMDVVTFLKAALSPYPFHPIPGTR